MRKKILIIEDDDFTRFMMQQIIQTLEVSPDVAVAENGEIGCTLVENNPHTYGLILMDIHMPNMSGVEATTRIRSNTNSLTRDIPIYAVTADKAFHELSTVEANGMDGFIAKPISPGGLIGLIEKYC